MFKVKTNTAWHRSGVFIVDFESAYQYSVSAFNFEKVCASRVWKTSHNVLKTQKSDVFVLQWNLQDLFHSAIYHCTELK